MVIQKKIITVLGVLSLVVLSLSYGARANADVITDSQIQSIKNHCLEIQSTLNRLQESDVLLRTDRGELYRAIADKLMVPLNQRIASNQLDGSALVAITASYNRQYNVFYGAYQNYAQSLSDASAIDCTKEPTRFYDALSVAHDKREVLHTSSQQLVALADQYAKQFTIFRNTTLKEHGQ